MEDQDQILKEGGRGRRRGTEAFCQINSDRKQARPRRCAFLRRLYSPRAPSRRLFISQPPPCSVAPSYMFHSRPLIHAALQPIHMLIPRDRDALPPLQPAPPRYAYSNPDSPSALLLTQPHASSSSQPPPAASAVPAPKRRHVCHTCDRTFTTSGHLARHTRVHTGERNHKCPFPGCETRCSRQDNLQQHYRIHLSPGSRRSTGTATRAAMTRALSTSERSTPGIRDTPHGGPRALGSSPPSPRLSPPRRPDPPNTPPLLTQAPLPLVLTPADEPVPPPSGTVSSRSSTTSTPDNAYRPPHARPPIFHSAESQRPADSLQSPDLQYPSSQAIYASPVSETHSQDGWAPADPHYVRDYISHSTLGGHASAPPSPAESPGGQSSYYTRPAYSMQGDYQLQYSEPSADMQYAQSAGVPHQGHAQMHATGSMGSSRLSIAHISPPRPRLSPLAQESMSPFSSHPSTPSYPPPGAFPMARLQPSSRVSASPQGSPSTERQGGEGMLVRPPYHHATYPEYAHARSMSGPAPTHPEYADSLAVHHSAQQQQHYVHSQSLPVYHSAQGGLRAKHISPPLTLAPIQDLRGGPDLNYDARARVSPTRSQQQPPGSSNAHGDTQTHPYYHQGPQQIAEPVYRDLRSHIEAGLTAADHEQGVGPPHAAGNYVPLHQPRPHHAGYAQQEQEYEYDPPPALVAAPESEWRVDSSGRRRGPLAR